MVSKKQVRLLNRYCGKAWVYISQLPLEDRTNLLPLEKKGLVQVKGRDKYDFTLWGQLRVTLRGEQYLRCLKPGKRSPKKPNRQKSVLSSINSCKNGEISPNNRERLIATRRRTKAFEERQRACEIERQGKVKRRVVENFGLTLDEILRVNDPDIRQKLLIQWRNYIVKSEPSFSLIVEVALKCHIPSKDFSTV